MLSCCTLPTEVIRYLVLGMLLLFHILVVTKKNRRAGLVMAAGCALDLFVGLAVPLTEVTGMVVMGRLQTTADQNMPWVMLAAFLVPLLARLTLATHSLCVLRGLFLLTRDLPDEGGP